MFIWASGARWLRTVKSWRPDLVANKRQDNEDEGPQFVEKNPWRNTSVAEVIAALDRGLIDDAETASFGRIFTRSGELSVRSVLLAVVPDDEDAQAAAEDALDWEAPAGIFSRVTGVRPKAVVWCSVSDRMVSGT